MCLLVARLGKNCVTIKLYILNLILLSETYLNIFFLVNYYVFWRKRDLNSYICDANTKDYHYPISPFFERGSAGARSDYLKYLIMRGASVAVSSGLIFI